jgi:hypothetical protein
MTRSDLFAYPFSDQAEMFETGSLQYQKKLERVLALTGMLDLQSFFVIAGDFL